MTRRAECRPSESCSPVPAQTSTTETLTFHRRHSQRGSTAQLRESPGRSGLRGVKAPPSVARRRGVCRRQELIKPAALAPRRSTNVCSSTLRSHVPAAQLGHAPAQAPGLKREETMRLLAQLQETDQRLRDLRGGLLALIEQASPEGKP